MTKNELLDHYCLNDSIKKYKGYKVKHPKETIDSIESAFSKIGLRIHYVPKEKTALMKHSIVQLGTGVLIPNESKNVTLLRSSGKGVAPLLSQASASAELIERFTGYGLAGGMMGSYLSIRKSDQKWNNIKMKNQWKDNLFPFHPIENIDYIPEKYREKYIERANAICYSLTRKKLFNYPEEILVKLAGSTGLAAGNMKEEAIVQGLCECLERLCGMYILDNFPECEQISIDSVTHPTLQKLIDAAHSIDINFKLYDFSFVFDIPIIATLFDHPEWSFPPNPYCSIRKQYPILKVGVATNPEDAAMRCFTEFFQDLSPIHEMISTYFETIHQFEISKLPINEIIHNRLDTFTTWCKNGNEPISIDLHKFYNVERKEISMQDIKSVYDENLKKEIEDIVRTLWNLELEVLVHDITNPILQFPVVRVMLSGGKDYFSQIPLVGYHYLIYGNKDSGNKYSYLHERIDSVLSQSKKIIDKLVEGEWCRDINQQGEIIDAVMRHLAEYGNDNNLWGYPINKFYCLGLLYLREKDYERAMNCFDAALSGNLCILPHILGKAYVYLKTEKTHDFEQIMDYANIINYDSKDLSQSLKEMENPIIVHNPFESCDFECSSRNKPHLCENCFFGYVNIDIFMEKYAENLLQKKEVKYT